VDGLLQAARKAGRTIFRFASAFGKKRGQPPAKRSTRLQKWASFGVGASESFGDVPPSSMGVGPPPMNPGGSGTAAPSAATTNTPEPTFGRGWTIDNPLFGC
jgi:hypothetical protein